MHLPTDLSLPLGVGSVPDKSQWEGRMSPDQSGQRVHVAWSSSMQSSRAPGHSWLEPQMIRSQPTTNRRYKWAQVTSLSHMHVLIRVNKTNYLRLKKYVGKDKYIGGEIGSLLQLLWEYKMV